MVFETHTVRVAQGAVTVRAVPLLLRGTLETADILSALSFVVVAIRVAQAATRGIGGAVLVVTEIQQGGLIDRAIQFSEKRCKSSPKMS